MTAEIDPFRMRTEKEAINEIRQRGRPPAEDRRDNIVKTYLSDEELTMLRKYASDLGLTDSAALRSLVRVCGVSTGGRAE